MRLKYGCNPNQKEAFVSIEGGELPIRTLNGTPGYINMLDALNGWQLVSELSAALGLPSAASFKHTSPAGAAVGVELTDELARAYMADTRDVSPQCSAYIRARGADRLSSYGDFVALSHACDLSTAEYLLREVSDGIIAPRYEKKALELLKSKRKGSYIILEIDENYAPPSDMLEERRIFGLKLAQQRNEVKIDASALADVVTKNKIITPDAVRDLTVALITLKYTQSNSVCCAYGGQTIGVGAGQQSRIHCTRLSCEKADLWRLRLHEKTLSLPFVQGLSRPARDNAVDAFISGYELPRDCFTKTPAPLTENEKADWLRANSGISLGSDGFFPFADNIDRAARSGVSFIAQPGGSVRDGDVISACDTYGMAMTFTHMRLFYH